MYTPQNISQNRPFIRCMPFSFSGDSLEYFKIWIINLCLTIVTLGIYSAWAKVRTNRYFYGNTWLDENNFAYLADPVKILKGRIIAIGFLAIYSLIWDFAAGAEFYLLSLIFFLFPAIMVTALAFQMQNSAYRNVRFSFDKNYKQAYQIFVTPIVLVLVLTWAGFTILQSSDFVAGMQEEHANFNTIDLLPNVLMLSFLPLLPYFDFLRTRFIVNHTQYGKSEASFAAGAWDFYRIYLIALLISIGLGILMSIVSFGIVMLLKVSGADPRELASGGMLIMIPVMVVFYALYFLVIAYLRAARTNMVFNQITFTQDTFHSELKTTRVFWLYLSNTIAIIVSLGLLIPWAQIRMAHYVASCTEFESRSLDEIEAAKEPLQNAFGEELGEAFDLDIGL